MKVSKFSWHYQIIHEKPFGILNPLRVEDEIGDFLTVCEYLTMVFVAILYRVLAVFFLGSTTFPLLVVFTGLDFEIGSWFEVIFLFGCFTLLGGLLFLGSMIKSCKKGEHFIKIV